MKKIKNLIVGAGPAGLAVAGRMRKANIDFTLFEKSQHVGESWRNRYDRLHLHTVKRWSHLPFMPFPDDYPTYVSRQQLVDYFEEYRKEFAIQPEFGKDVFKIKKAANGWAVELKDGENVLAENIVIATGLNNVPIVPKWPGQEQFKGNIAHAVGYKNPSPFNGKKVLVVGIGNTGAEIALDLANHGVTTYIVARSEITLVPRDLNGRPVQETGKLLEKLPFGFGDWLGSQIRKVYYGDLSKYGLKISNEYPAVALRETGKTPLIDIGTIAAIKNEKIKVVGDIGCFEEKGVRLKSGGFIEVEEVILATGYQAKIEELIERGSELLDKYGIPKGPVGEGFHEGLYFVGFDNYKLGGILGTIFTDSETVVDSLT